MTVRGVSGQPDPGWISQYQPTMPAAQDQEPAYPPFDGPKLGKKPNLDNGGKNLEHWSDLRGGNLNRHKLSEQFQNMDLSKLRDVLMTCTFDLKTPWPKDKNKMPPNFDPNKILEIRKDPGLGIRNLQENGIKIPGMEKPLIINGDDINVAIVDQPLLRNHEEYEGQLAKYTEVGATEEEIKNGSWKPQMHGPAVSSMLVGKKCGVAPKASLYYWAVTPRKAETREEMVDNYIADTIKAIREIIKHNKDNKENPKALIKVVSVSRGCGPYSKMYEEWENVRKEAKEKGLIVITTDSNFHGVGCPLYPVDNDRNNPANYKVCYFARKDGVWPGLIYVPVDNRTYASNEAVNEYTSEADGGMSWGIPYAAGVMALGFQVEKELKKIYKIDYKLEEKDIYQYLWDTGTPFKGGRIVNPRAFVEKIATELLKKREM